MQIFKHAPRWCAFWLLAFCAWQLPSQLPTQLLGDTHLTPTEIWTPQVANAWYAKQPWIVGSNYIPSTAINQIEMWQPDSFDPNEIDRDLGLAEGLGMNTMRVFLHDLVWQDNPREFQERVDAFLKIANRHHIKPILVLFDSCWDPFPKTGVQREPTPGVHNSGWVQSPGAKSLQDPNDRTRISNYVRFVVGTYAKDPRVLAWDVWNEPDNLNQSSYGRLEPSNKVKLVQDLLPMIFLWAREKHPIQPLTSGLWHGDWSSDDKLTPMEQIQISRSDVISFHSYGAPAEFEARILSLKRLNKPIFCTEYMARPQGSTFESILPIAKKYKVAAINWGFIAGKTQTYLPWDSWQHPYTDRQPPVWFHDIFKEDGKPYRQDEVDFIRKETAR